jgi:putative ABC transport system ATP-binding protein
MKATQLDRFRAKQMGFIFQSFFVEPRQTCFQNVMLPLEIARVSRRKRRALAEGALEAVDLAEKIDMLASTLSGGQKQRLAIARSIVSQPKLLFADEPTGNLDSVTGDKIMSLLFDLNKRLGVTLVIVTHDPDIASQCDRQIVISDGELVTQKPVSKRKVVQ